LLGQSTSACPTLQQLEALLAQLSTGGKLDIVGHSPDDDDGLFCKFLSKKDEKFYILGIFMIVVTKPL